MLYLLFFLLDISLSLMHIKRLLVAANNEFESSTFLILSQDSFRSVAGICGIDESEYTDLLAYNSTEGKSKWYLSTFTYTEQ